jgi:transposase InsO family protein
MKFYYENVLVNQNKTAKTNIAWVADITEIELNRNKKLYVFLCLDIHSNTIIAQTFSQRVITSQATVNCLKKAIKKRFVIIPKMKTILHTDRGTQFSSQCYNSFINQFEQFIIPSMSRENTPTDNGVAERFMRTFKGHQIDGKIIEQAIQEAILPDTISGSKSYRSIVNMYLKS